MSRISKIQIANKSGSPKNYLLFMVEPHISNIPSGRISFNVYDSAPRIEPDASVEWECVSSFFAIYGTAQTASDGSKKVAVSASRRVALGPGGDSVSLNVNGDDNASFENTRSGSCNARGGFQFRTNGFSYPNKSKSYWQRFELRRPLTSFNF